MDDPRNTDNAWMETEAVNYHDDTGGYLHTCSQLSFTHCVALKLGHVLA